MLDCFLILRMRIASGRLCGVSERSRSPLFIRLQMVSVTNKEICNAFLSTLASQAREDPPLASGRSRTWQAGNAQSTALLKAVRHHQSAKDSKSELPRFHGPEAEAEAEVGEDVARSLQLGAATAQGAIIRHLAYSRYLMKAKAIPRVLSKMKFNSSNHPHARQRVTYHMSHPHSRQRQKYRA